MTSIRGVALCTGMGCPGLDLIWQCTCGRWQCRDPAHWRPQDGPRGLPLWWDVHHAEAWKNNPGLLPAPRLVTAAWDYLIRCLFTHGVSGSSLPPRALNTGDVDYDVALQAALQAEAVGLGRPLIVGGDGREIDHGKERR